jgi:hypothetical protein
VSAISGESYAELADGTDVALFGIDTANMNDIAIVRINASLKAGHAAHPRCPAARRWLHSHRAKRDT